MERYYTHAPHFLSLALSLASKISGEVSDNYRFLNIISWWVTGCFNEEFLKEIEIQNL